MLPPNPKPRWIRSVVEGSALDMPLPWARIRHPRGLALGIRA